MAAQNLSENVNEASARSSVPADVYQIVRDGNAIRIAGDLRMHDAAAIWKDLRKETNDASGDIVFDLRSVEAADGGVMALLVDLRMELAARGVKAEIANANERVETIVDLYSGHDGIAKKTKRKPEGAIAQVGRATVEVKEEAKGILDFFGSMVLAGFTLIRHPRAGHWKEVMPLMERTGADAVPIVVLINFLVGFVMAFQSAKQLKMFGANIYVADLVGISLTRELAPLMTAIIVCGRSGAAFAAEIGSMKVNEEVDALRTLGLTPFGWLVVPRIAALVLVVPILTLLADFIGISGGLVVGITDLDLTPQGYIIETLDSVRGMDVFTGLVKSVVFSIAIALIACQQGFAATGGAEGVGKRTTSTVVTSLFSLVLIDALFTVIFRVFDL
ncbi:MAG: ABC-type transport system involved in resistance to organic solvent, permease component [Labilithrix sp.]|nr:ABC-type transport system involved in resistance to organic solvent, permease component [Labilithrix sp.]